MPERERISHEDIIQRLEQGSRRFTNLEAGQSEIRNEQKSQHDTVAEILSVLKTMQSDVVATKDIVEAWAVAFGPYAGEAGVQERADGTIEVAFAAELRKLRGVTEGTVDGQAVEVLTIAKAAFVTGLVVLTCRKTGDQSQ